MQVVRIETGAFAENCYLVWAQPPAALLIDPGDDAPAIREALAKRDLAVDRYLLTHGHIDHISALPKLLESHPAPVDLHPRDARWAFTEVNQLPPYYMPLEAPVEIDREYAEGQEWTDAGLAYRILEMPGHTPGGVAMYFEQEKALFGGDNLFRGGIGRTDLPGGDAPTLQKTLQRLATLPDDTTVYPGHGPPTTIAQEKQTNPFLPG